MALSSDSIPSDIYYTVGNSKYVDVEDCLHLSMENAMADAKARIEQTPGKVVIVYKCVPIARFLK